MTTTRSEPVRMTGRQYEVAKLAAAGKTIDEIGDELAITGSTVKQHLARARRLLGVERKRHIMGALEAAETDGRLEVSG